MKYIGYISTSLLHLFLSAVWSGYVLSVLWAWFVVGLFPGAPALSIPSALGIAMIVRYLTYQKEPEDKNKSTRDRIIELAALSFFRPLFALIFGAVVRMFL